MGVMVGLRLMSGMVMGMAAVFLMVIMAGIIRPMAVMVLMGMGMGVPVGMGVGFAVMGMGMVMIVNMVMVMGMFMSVQFYLHWNLLVFYQFINPDCYIGLYQLI